MSRVLRPDFWELYSGKREVLGHALFDHDPYDQFAWCQEWRFSICNYLYHARGYRVPHYRPGAGGPDVSYGYETLAETDPPIGAMLYALRILDRYREWLRIAGKDY